MAIHTHADSYSVGLLAYRQLEFCWRSPGSTDLDSRMVVCRGCESDGKDDTRENFWASLANYLLDSGVPVVLAYGDSKCS